MINKPTNQVSPVGLRPRGFTLIETLVAILLLTMSIAGPLTIASKGLSAALVSKDQTAAFYLAQDAVEYVRFVRDSNKLAAASWLAGLEACTSADGSVKCYLDSLQQNPATPQTCISGVCPPLTTDASNRGFNYSGGSFSIYTRTISITTPVCASGGAPCNAGEAAVVVGLTWRDIAGITHSIVVRENLYDWQ